MLWIALNKKLASLMQKMSLFSKILLLIPLIIEFEHWTNNNVKWLPLLSHFELHVVMAWDLGNVHHIHIKINFYISSKHICAFWVLMRRWGLSLKILWSLRGYELGTSTFGMKFNWMKISRKGYENINPNNTASSLRVGLIDILE